MSRYFIFSILVLFPLFSACHKKAMTGSGTKTPENKTLPTTSSEIKKVIIDPELDIAALGGAPINVDSLAISGDILSIFVNYGGGCKQHSFDLYSNRMYAKSLPPKLTLFLKHTNNDDACRKLIMRELKFNISEIKYTNSLSIKVANKVIKYEPK